MLLYTPAPDHCIIYLELLSSYCFLSLMLRFIDSFIPRSPTSLSFCPSVSLCFRLSLFLSIFLFFSLSLSHTHSFSLSLSIYIYIYSWLKREVNWLNLKRYLFT